jgi:hypothetical protein
MALTQQFLPMDKLDLEKLLQCLDLIGMIAAVSLEDIKILWAKCFPKAMVLSLREKIQE